MSPAAPLINTNRNGIQLIETFKGSQKRKNSALARAFFSKGKSSTSARGVRGAKTLSESSVDGLFFELFHIQNARCGVEHSFRETCKNVQNLAPPGVSPAASLINPTCNRDLELQGPEKRKKSFGTFLMV